MEENQSIEKLLAGEIAEQLEICHQITEATKSVVSEINKEMQAYGYLAMVVYYEEYMNYRESEWQIKIQDHDYVIAKYHLQTVVGMEGDDFVDPNSNAKPKEKSYEDVIRAIIRDKTGL